jgi:hypothetical protein
MRRVIMASAVLFALVAARPARGQELNLSTASAERPGVVEARAGLDHAFVGEIGYRHVLAWGDRQLVLGGDVAIPFAKPDLHDYRLRATVGLPLGGQQWKLAGWLSPTLRGTDNPASEMTALGVDLRLTGGYYARRWFAAGELGLDWVAATHVTFSDAYRTTGYSGAKDGWYRAPGGTTYAGLHAGLSFSSFDVIVRLGVPRTTALEQQTVPFYLTLGVNVALPP